MRRAVRGFLVTMLAAASAAVPLAAEVATAPAAAAAVAPPSTPARVGVPQNIYAIGDSITTATGTGQLGAEQPFNSWITGVHPTIIRDGREGSPNVLSMRHRLGIPNENAFNLAANGRRMEHFDDQANGLPSTAQYVVVELGGNDLCKESVAEMTSVADYRNQFRAGLAMVANRAPNALVFVASIPDIYNLWFIRGFNDDQTGQANKAHFFWDNPTGFNIPCESLLADPTSNDADDVNRRQAVRTRNIAFNQVLAQECNAVLRCRFDQNGLFNGTSNRVSPPNGPLLPRNQWEFEDRDISHNQGGNGGFCPVNFSYSGCGDHFHPSLWGQAKLARFGDELSYQFFDDFAAPTATATPDRAPDGNGVYADSVQVTFGGTDPSNIRGQEVRLQTPAGALGPWQPSIGLAPPVTVSAVGTTYLQVRSLDGNGNLSASTTQAITIDPSQFGEVNGTITDADGPLAGIEVSIHLADAEGAVLTDTTGPDGVYGFEDVLAGGLVKIEAHDPTAVHLDEWYDGASSHATATPIPTPSASATTADIELDEPPPPDPGAITGTVVGPDGPVEDVVVTAAPGGATATTDAGGHYEINGLDPGPYTVSADAVPCQWLGDDVGVTVTSGGTATGDLTLAEEPPAAHGFSDVPERLDEAVSWIVDPCNSPTFMDGFPDDTFKPSRILNRAQAVNALWHINGSPAVATPHGLSGVPAWVEPAVRWAVADQYLTGFADGSFGPTRPLTRAQIARLFFRLAGEPDVSTPHGLTGVPAWAEPAVRWAVAEGLMGGFDDGSFRGDREIQRGQFALIAFLTYG